MPPGVAMLDGGYGLDSHAVCLGYIAPPFAFAETTANFPNLVCREFRVAVIAAAHYLGVFAHVVAVAGHKVAATLSHAVVAVLLVRSKHQMCGIAAYPVVARVHDEHGRLVGPSAIPRQRYAVMKFVRDPMGEPHRTLERDKSIASGGADAQFPWPALTGFADLDVPPEPLWGVSVPSTAWHRRMMPHRKGGVQWQSCV